MLKEVGNRNREIEETFLIENCKDMPHTMLRYAIEKLGEHERRLYLGGTK